MVEAIESARWRRLQSTEARASRCASALTSLYRLPENIGFASVVKPELKFVQVQRQIFLAHVMIRPDDSALQQGPKRINRLSMNLAAHVFAKTVRNGFMPVAAFQHAVARMLVRGDQFYLIAHGAAHERIERFHIGSFDHLADDIALARDRADNWSLPRRAFGIWSDALAAVFILFLTADESFIHLDNAHQFFEIIILHSGAESHADVPCRTIGASAEKSMELKSADAFLARKHQVQNFIPSAQWHLGFFKDSSRFEREPIRRAIIFATFLALPVPRPRCALIDMIVIASRAMRPVRPATQEQISPARLLIGERPIKVGKGHLAREPWLGRLVILHASDISGKRNGSQQAHNSLRKSPWSAALRSCRDTPNHSYNPPQEPL